MKEVTEGAHSTHKYNGALMIVDYFQKSDSWQCMDARFTIKGRGDTKEEAVSNAHKQWDEYKRKNEL